MVFDTVSRHKVRILSLKVFKSHIAREKKDRIVSTEVELEETTLLTFSRKLPTIKQATQMLVDEAMKRSEGNQSIAARMLGVSHQALSKRLKSKNSEARSRKSR
jgi:DNA-binding NtrC family response regulator